jgi:AcrR family transcriptional regulator
VSEVEAKREQRGRRRRADAERSITAILDAAMRLLAERPGASMAEIAAAAGVARQTIYAHYESREALLAAVARRALDQSLAAIDAAEPDRGPPADALDRLVRSWWLVIEPHARVLESLAPAFPDPHQVHDLHAPILERLERLIERGHATGSFDRDLAPGWLAAAFLALMHAAAEEVSAGRLAPDHAGRALERTVPRLFGSKPKPARG